MCDDWSVCSVPGKDSGPCDPASVSPGDCLPPAMSLFWCCHRCLACGDPGASRVHESFLVLALAERAWCRCGFGRGTQPAVGLSPACHWCDGFSRFFLSPTVFSAFTDPTQVIPAPIAGRGTQAFSLVARRRTRLRLRSAIRMFVPLTKIAQLCPRPKPGRP